MKNFNSAVIMTILVVVYFITPAISELISVEDTTNLITKHTTMVPMCAASSFCMECDGQECVLCHPDNTGSRMAKVGITQASRTCIENLETIPESNQVRGCWIYFPKPPQLRYQYMDPTTIWEQRCMLCNDKDFLNYQKAQEYESCNDLAISFSYSTQICQKILYCQQTVCYDGLNTGATFCQACGVNANPVISKISPDGVEGYRITSCDSEDGISNCLYQGNYLHYTICLYCKEGYIGNIGFGGYSTMCEKNEEIGNCQQLLPNSNNTLYSNITDQKMLYGTDQKDLQDKFVKDLETLANAAKNSTCNSTSDNGLVENNGLAENNGVRNNSNCTNSTSTDEDKKEELIACKVCKWEYIFDGRDCVGLALLLRVSKLAIVFLFVIIQ